MSQAYDDFIKRLTEMLEAHAAPEPASEDDAEASDPTGEGASTPLARLTQWPLPLEAVQAVQAADDVTDAYLLGQDWRAQARAAFGYAAPGALGSGTDRRWTAEQQRTIDALRQMQAQVPGDLAAWRARMGLPGYHSSEEPWVEQAGQTSQAAAVSVPSLPTQTTVDALPTPAEALLLPPPGPAAESVEQTPKQSEQSSEAAGSAPSTAPQPAETD
jgi:hypothetical protein